MAYENHEVFGAFCRTETLGGEEISVRWGRKILVLAEINGDEADVYSVYLRTLGVLGTYGTEVARARVIHQEGWEYPRTVLAEQVFLFPREQHEGGTILRSMPGDNEDSDDGIIRVTHDRKFSSQELGQMSEVAVQYDGLAEPPVLRIIDVQGSDRQGNPQSELPGELLPALKAAVSTSR